ARVVRVPAARPSDDDRLHHRPGPGGQQHDPARGAHAAGRGGRHDPCRCRALQPGDKAAADFFEHPDRDIRNAAARPRAGARRRDLPRPGRGDRRRHSREPRLYPRPDAGHAPAGRERGRAQPGARYSLPEESRVTSISKALRLAAILTATAGVLSPGELAWAQRAADPPTVGVMTARMVRMAPTMAVPGTVVSRNDSQLASEVEGRVSWVADVGTVVAANDVVARVDSSIASLQLASDKANVARLAAQVTFDRSQAERMDNLFKQNAIAKSTRDQAIATRDMDLAPLAQARAALKKSAYQLAHAAIRAPFPGRVVARLINAGEYVVAGKPVLRLVDVGSLEVSAQVPIDTTRYIRETMPLTVALRLTLPAGAGLVGDAVKVLIPSAAPRNVLAVSRDALVLREDNTYVFKIDGKGHAQRVAVEAGTEQGALIEIRGQIAPGERVIVRGAERLETGQKVRPVQAS